MVTPSDVLAARNRVGWSQQRLAQHLGIDVKTLGGWEAGRTGPFRKGWVLLEDFTAAATRGKAALDDYLEQTTTTPTPVEPGLTVAQVLADASDLDLIAALSQRLASLRAAGGHPTGETSTGQTDQDHLLDAIEANPRQRSEPGLPETPEMEQAEPPRRGRRAPRNAG